MTSNLIIVEGIDRVGKTTLCQILSNQFNVPIFKEYPFYDGFERKIMVEKMDTVLNVLKTTNSHLIADRFHLSEFVYGKVERLIPYSASTINALEAKMNELNTILIYVRPTSLERSESEDGRKLSRHLNMFEMFYSKSKIAHKLSCDYDSLADVCSRVLLLDKKIQKQKLSKNYFTY